MNRVLEVLDYFEYKNLESNEISFIRHFHVIHARCAILKKKKERDKGKRYIESTW